MVPHRLRQALAGQFGILRDSRFLRDRLFVGCLVAVVLLMVAMWGLLLLRVHPTTFPVPVHYTTLGGFDALGPWDQPFQAGAYATILVLIDLLLAYMSYHRSRLASFFLLAGAAVVALFSLIIANAFSALN